MRGFLVGSVIAFLILALFLVGNHFGFDPSFIFRDLSSFLTVVLLPGFIAWSSKNLSGHLKQVDFNMSQLSTDTSTKYRSLETSISSLKRDVGDIRSEVKRLSLIKDAKSSYRRELLNTQNMCLDFMKYNENLFKFASLKGDAFRVFVMDLHDMEITSDCAEAVVRLGITISEDMRLKGNVFLGEPFMNLYYTSHSKAVEVYLKEICRIFTDPDNSKHERLQEHSVRFLRLFLSSLNKAFLCQNSK